MDEGVTAPKQCVIVRSTNPDYFERKAEDLGGALKEMILAFTKKEITAEVFAASYKLACMTIIKEAFNDGAKSGRNQNECS